MSVCQNCVGVVGALIRLIFRLCKRKWDGLSQWPQRLSLRANEVTQHSPYSSLTVHMCLNVPAALWNTFLQLHFGFSASYTHCENTHFTLIVCLLALALSGSYVKIFIFTLWNSVTPAYTNHTYTHHIAYSRKLTSFCSVQAGFDSFAVCQRFVTVLIVPDRHLFTSLTLSVSMWWNHIPIISSLGDPGRCTARWEVSEWENLLGGRTRSCFSCSSHTAHQLSTGRFILELRLCSPWWPVWPPDPQNTLKIVILTFVC